jgi:hypothetical protein
MEQSSTCCGIMAIGVSDTASQYLAFAGKISISAAFTLVYLYSSELFPTDVRSIALGFCNIAARIAAFLSPVIVSSQNHNQSI